MSQDEQDARMWAGRAAKHIVDGALKVAERLPKPDQNTLLREIARRALWHMQNSSDEARDLVRYIDVENLKQPHPGDDEPPWA
jgi:hypothetical protein